MPSTVAAQRKQREWLEQWTLLQDNERFLFEDWIYPNTLADFADKTVLDCGCGGGQHVRFCAPVARRVLGIDLNTSALARSRSEGLSNVEFRDADIATFDPDERFDIVYCIGVIHHTDDPDRTFDNIVRLCKPGGRVIIWCYSAEGNEFVERVVEPVRKLLLARLSRRALIGISNALTVPMSILAHTIYRIPALASLPYFEYFENFRRMTFQRNMLNVFDKLNAPQTQFITQTRIRQWFDRPEFASVHLDRYKGVSWRATGIRKP